MTDRESLFGERVVWTGAASRVSTPPLLRAVALLLFILSAVSLSFALVVSLVLEASPTATLLFSAWCASLGLASFSVPRIWQAQVRYIVTEHHVICKRGPFRRSIERRAISFARIFWDKSSPGIGDIELVRAVPTGALRRRLKLRLNGLSAPDRVWAIIRGEQSVAPLGHGERPLAQRLDADERVVWSAQPRPRLRAYLPQGQRQWATIAISLLLVAVLARMLVRAVPVLSKLIEAGVAPRSFGFAALVFGLGTSIVLVFAVAAFLFYDTIVKPGRLVRHTRYLITNKRVLIQRGREELHLDRGKIVDVIDAPAGAGLRHVFLVLDGPRARAVAMSGAFGETARRPNLIPVLEALEDADSASRILRDSEPSIPRAA